MAAEGAGEGHALGRGAGALREQLGAGVERRLGELDSAHVGLVDEEPWLTLVEHIGEGAADLFDPLRSLGQRALDDAVLRHDPA